MPEVAAPDALVILPLFLQRRSLFYYSKVIDTFIISRRIALTGFEYTVRVKTPVSPISNPRGSWIPRKGNQSFFKKTRKSFTKQRKKAFEAPIKKAYPFRGTLVCPLLTRNEFLHLISTGYNRIPMTQSIRNILIGFASKKQSSSTPCVSEA